MTGCSIAFNVDRRQFLKRPVATVFFESSDHHYSFPPEPGGCPGKGMNMLSSRFVVTVIGLDKVGIVAEVSRVMAEHQVNIVDISQTIMSDLFTMIMLAEVSAQAFDLATFQEAMSTVGKKLGVEINVQHEDAFRFMHRI